MARSTPSLLALLGIAAMAGYQNRDRLGALLGRPDDPGGTGAGGGLSDLLSGANAGGRGFSDIAEGLTGGSLASGLRDLVGRLASGGRRDLADSWVGTGPNRQATRDDIETGLDAELLQDLSDRTGLTHEELLRRLSDTLPDTVDALTPQGRLPE